MPGLEDLRNIFTELSGLKHSDEFSLRILAIFAQRGLNAMSDPIRNRDYIRKIIIKMREILLAYSSDPDMNRIEQVLQMWWLNLRPGPRKFESNASRNPIYLPGDDEVPGAMVYQFAVLHKYSREFADEMVEWLIPKNYHAKSEGDIHLYLMHAVAGVKQNGRVFHGTERSIQPVRGLLMRHQLPFDKYPVHGGYMIWVPKDQRAEVKALIRDSGLESL